MATYAGVGRSNAFRVADSAQFLAWVDTLDDVSAVEEGEDTYVLLCEGGQGDWPCIRVPEGDEATDEDAADEDEEFDIFGELSDHLAEGAVAVLEAVGREKLVYLVGYAVAVNHRGETVTVNLDDIYEKAAEAWGEESIPRAVR